MKPCRWRLTEKLCALRATLASPWLGGGTGGGGGEACPTGAGNPGGRQPILVLTAPPTSKWSPGSAPSPEAGTGRPAPSLWPTALTQPAEEGRIWSPPETPVWVPHLHQARRPVNSLLAPPRLPPCLPSALGSSAHISIFRSLGDSSLLILLHLFCGCLRVFLFRGFPGGAVVKNPPANAGDTGASPGLGRSHMPQSN